MTPQPLEFSEEVRKAAAEEVAGDVLDVVYDKVLDAVAGVVADAPDLRERVTEVLHELGLVQYGEWCACGEAVFPADEHECAPEPEPTPSYFFQPRVRARRARAGRLRGHQRPRAG